MNLNKRWIDSDSKEIYNELEDLRIEILFCTTIYDEKFLIAYIKQEFEKYLLEKYSISFTFSIKKSNFYLV